MTDDMVRQIEDAGASLADVVRTRKFFVYPNDAEAVGRAHAAAFKSNEAPLLVSTKAFGIPPPSKGLGASRVQITKPSSEGSPDATPS